MNILEKTQALVVKDLDLDLPDDIISSEEQLIEVLSIEIEYYLTHKIMFLFQILYRLDIDERKVQGILSLKGDEQPSKSIAKLIIEREKQKVLSRIKYG